MKTTLKVINDVKPDIIHVFGFDKNTRNAIILRAKKEEEDSQIKGLEDAGHILMIDKKASMETTKKSIE